MTTEDKIASLQRQIDELHEDRREMSEAIRRVAEACDRHREETRAGLDSVKESAHADALRIRNALIAFIGTVVAGGTITLITTAVPG